MAGQVADGVHVHPLNTPTYLRETVLPELEAGAARSGRSVDDLEVIVPAFLCRRRHRGGAARLAGDGPGPGRLLRVDAQLRLHLRAARPRGHDRADPRAPAGRRRGRHGGGDRRRPAGELRDDGHLGRHRRRDRGQVRRHGHPGRQLLHRVRCGAQPRGVRALGRARPAGRPPSTDAGPQASATEQPAPGLLGPARARPAPRPPARRRARRTSSSSPPSSGGGRRTRGWIGAMSTSSTVASSAASASASRKASSSSGASCRRRRAGAACSRRRAVGALEERGEPVLHRVDVGGRRRRGPAAARGRARAGASGRDRPAGRTRSVQAEPLQ